MLLFEYSYILLLLLPILYCLYKCREEIVKRNFVHLQLFRMKKPRFWMQNLWKLLITLLLIFSLASPIVIDKTNPLNRQGIDIVLAIDASGSMRASGLSEVRETRFETVQRVVREFIAKRVNDNVGIVLFGDFAFIASPVTYEKNIVSLMVSYLQTGMAGDNTAIGEGIQQSIRALSFSKAKSKLIILLSDGEHNSGRISPKDAVKLAQKRDVKIYTIAIGNDFSPALLEEIAHATGGKSYVAVNEEELKEVYAEINEMENSEIKSHQFLKKDYYYQYILIMTFFLLVAYVLRRFRGLA
ncbi:VWA domain-containing protein [Sulfurimonas sp. MAG313]|nr:VWA domain-containing protein [Sulfurimonas sp. MAG313]